VVSGVGVDVGGLGDVEGVVAGPGEVGAEEKGAAVSTNVSEKLVVELEKKVLSRVELLLRELVAVANAETDVAAVENTDVDSRATMEEEKRETEVVND